MYFKTIYVIAIGISLLAFAFMFVRDPVIYYLYGYDPALIGSSAGEAFVAFKRTQLARDVFYFIALGAAIFTLVASCIAIYRRVYLDFYFSYFVCFANVLLLLAYFIGLVIPKRSF
jgi:peptidoglycan/LPS O-acetylase OafA/YrhL